jgi:assimilatory nitrate reductase catalytic subunit
MADLHLPVASDTDIALFNGLLVHLAETGRIDRAFTGRHVNGLSETLAAPRADAPLAASIAAACGVDPKALETFYAWFGAIEQVVTV